MPKSEIPKEAADMVQLKLRFKEETRAKLEAAAKSHGNSLNTEIVERLNRTLDEEERLGGRERFALHHAIAAALDKLEHQIGAGWASSRPRFQMALGAINAALQSAFQPDFDAPTEKTLRSAFEEMDAAKAAVDETYTALIQLYPEAANPSESAMVYDTGFQNVLGELLAAVKPVEPARFAARLTEAQVDATCASLTEEHAAMLRIHQENIRKHELAEAKVYEIVDAIEMAEQSAQYAGSNLIRRLREQ